MSSPSELIHATYKIQSDKPMDAPKKAQAKSIALGANDRHLDPE